MSLPTAANPSARTANGNSFDAVQKEFDTMLTQLFTAPVAHVRPVAGGRLAPFFTPAYATYGVDVREDADHLYVEADLPGFKKGEVEVTLENRTLTIAAGHAAPAAPAPTDGTAVAPAAPRGEYLLNERRPAPFHRTFRLPQTVGEQAVQARLEDGVLTVTLAKREETKPRKISVD